MVSIRNSCPESCLFRQINPQTSRRLRGAAFVPDDGPLGTEEFTRTPTAPDVSRDRKRGTSRLIGRNPARHPIIEHGWMPCLRASSMKGVKSLGEPCNLKACRPTVVPASGLTCGRPGRSFSRTGAISDEAVECWAAGLPEAPTLHLISLLGTKKDGKSEYSYYSFAAAMNTPESPHFKLGLIGASGRRGTVFTNTRQRMPAQTHFLRQTLTPSGRS